MQFKVDENLPVEVAESLRQAGYGARTVLEQDLGGVSDRKLADVCRRENRAAIPFDTDFADIRSYPPSHFSGLIVLRLRRQDKHHVLQTINRLIPLLSQEPLQQLLWIVEEDRIRIRS